MGRNDPLYGAERPIILGAERPATWGGTTHDVGQINPREVDRPGADQPWGGSTGTRCVNVNTCVASMVFDIVESNVCTDYVNGGEMFTHLYQRERFAEPDVRIYIGEIVLALERLHSVRLALLMLIITTIIHQFRRICNRI